MYKWCLCEKFHVLPVKVQNSYVFGTLLLSKGGGCFASFCACAKIAHKPRDRLDKFDGVAVVSHSQHIVSVQYKACVRSCVTFLLNFAQNSVTSSFLNTH